MVVVHRAFGFRFVMFTNDHEPPHVHVFGHGGEAKIALGGADGPVLVRFVGMSRADLRRVLDETSRVRTELLAEWRRIRG